VCGLQEWVEQPVGVAVNPGEDAVLTCRLLAKKGDCRWERNGLPVGLYQGKYEWAGNPAQGDCSLRLREASIQYDQGDWVCQVTASSFMEKDTLISSPAKLIVRGNILAQVMVYRSYLAQVTASSFMEKDILISSPAKFIVRGKILAQVMVHRAYLA
jgi:hypothetical protein